MDDAQTRTYTAALAVAGSQPERERLAFAILTESNGYVWANDGRNTSNSPGVTPAIAAILRTSLHLPHDKVGSNGRSTGPLQQTSSDVGGAWGDLAGTMDPAESARRFLRVLNVTTVSQYVGTLLTPTGSQRVAIDLSDPIAADVLRVQQPLADEAQSSNYNAAQVQLARDIAAQFSQPEEYLMVSKEEFASVMDDKFGGVKGNAADAQQRLRGSDTGIGQEHHDYDMLQGIAAELKALALVVLEIKERLRGTDTAAGQMHENYDMLQGLVGNVGDIGQKIVALTALVEAKP